MGPDASPMSARTVVRGRGQLLCERMNRGQRTSRLIVLQCRTTMEDAMSRMPMAARLLVTGSACAALLFGPVLAATATGAPTIRPSATIPNDPTVLAKAQSLPFSRTVPGFPSTVKGYRLRDVGRTETRLFQGRAWEALSPLRQPLGRCGDFRWYLRWRSANPEVLIDAAVGDTGLPGFNRITRASRGGAGYLTGYGCVSPGLRFGTAVSGNQANLVDVDYEYQVWEENRPI